MDFNFEGEKARNNCFRFDNLKKPRSSRLIANSKICALGFLIVTYFAIQNGGLKNGAPTQDKDILERKILKKDILGKDTPLGRYIFERNSDGLIASSPNNVGKYQATNILKFQPKQRINAFRFRKFGLAFINKETKRKLIALERKQIYPEQANVIHSSIEREI